MKPVPADILRIAQETEAANPEALVAVLDSDGFIWYRSRNAERLNGRQDDECLGKHFSEIYAAMDVLHMHLSIQDAILTGESVNTTRTVVARDGRRTRMKGTARILVDEIFGEVYVLQVARKCD